MSITVEDFMKTATGAQRSLLITLRDLAKTERELVDQVEEIFDSIEEGVHTADGYSLAPCEDEDDARVNSMEPRDRLRGVRRKMKSFMIKAIELGMGDLGIIQRTYEHYVGEPLPTY